MKVTSKEIVYDFTPDGIHVTSANFSKTYRYAIFQRKESDKFGYLHDSYGGAISRTDTIDNGNKILEKSDFIVNGKLHEKEGAKCIRLPYSMINKLFIPQFSSNAKKKALEMQLLKNTEEKRAFAHVADVFVLLSKKRVSLFNAVQYIESNFKELKKMADSGRDSKIVTSVVHVTFDKSDEEVKDFDMITAEVGVISRYTEPDDRKIWDMYKTDKKKIVGMIARDIKTRPRFEKSGYTVSDFFSDVSKVNRFKRNCVYICYKRGNREHILQLTKGGMNNVTRHKRRINNDFGLTEGFGKEKWSKLGCRRIRQHYVL